MVRKTPMNGTTLPDAAPPRVDMPVSPPSVGRATVPELAGGRNVGSPGSRTSWSEDPRLPACLLSTIFHTLLLLILAFVTYHGRTGIRQSILAKQVDGDSPQRIETFEPLTNERFDANARSDQPVPVQIETSKPVAVTSPAQAETEADVLDPDLLALAAPGGAKSESVSKRLPSGGGISKRSPEGRLEYGRKYGATARSEKAVEAALAWLAAHQRDDGSWSLNLELDPCNGRCRHSKKKGEETPTPSTGATGLALLAFLGAGHTHQNDGPYRETVRRGIYYLRAVAAEASAGYDWQQGSMYGHGIALMALAEALAMTSKDGQGDSDLRDLVRNGAAFTSVAQHPSGSWGYVPGSPGDITVSGWQVMSLIAARKNQIALRTNMLPDAKAFVMSTCTENDYWFGYKGPPGEPTTTAIGLTLLLYLGQSPDYTPFYLAMTEMADRGPTLTNIYHDYYATLALHHSRHRDWDRWNTKLRDHLIATQATSGHEAGSWHFPDRWGDIGGRLYTTAMCAMTLEVYYRYMPLYGDLDEFPL